MVFRAGVKIVLGGSAALAAVVLWRKWQVKTYDQITQTVEDIGEIEYHNKKLSELVQDLKLKITDLEFKITDLSTKHKKEVLHLTEQLGEAQKENAKLKEALDDVEDQLTPGAYANPLMQVEERNQMEEIISKYKREKKEVTEELATTTSAYSKEITTLKVKLQNLEKENAKMLIVLNNVRRKEKTQLEQEAITREVAWDKEVKDLNQQNIIYKKEVSHLRDKLQECFEVEIKSSEDVFVEMKKRKQLQFEVDILKIELDDAKTSLSQHKRFLIEMSTRNINMSKELGTSNIEKQPSSMTLNNAVSITDPDDFRKTLYEKQELEEEADKYKSQARRLLSQYQIIQERESEQDQQLKEIKKMVMEAKKSELEIQSRHIEEKTLLEENQKMFSDLETKHQLLSSKLARSKQKTRHERENLKNLKKNQEEMGQYIDRLVAVVMKNCPGLLESQDIQTNMYKC